MKLFKKGTEYNNLAKGFNGTYILLNELEVKIQNHNDIDYSEFNTDIFAIAYLCRTEIKDRLNQYGWGMNSPILIPMMSKGRVTLQFAYQQTVGRLHELAKTAAVSYNVLDILDRGDTYYEIESNIPSHIKNAMK